MHASRLMVLSPLGIVISIGLVANCGGSPPDSGPAADSTPTYLGEQPPDETPQPFAPGIVSTDAIELNGVVSPDGREFFFTRVIDGVFIMHRRLLGEDALSAAGEGEFPGHRGLREVSLVERVTESVLLRHSHITNPGT